MGETTTPTLRQGEVVGETQGGYEGRESEWALPRPSDPRSPPKTETGGEGATTRGTKDKAKVLMSKGTLPLGNNYWRLIRNAKRRLAALARDHIMKLREERDRLQMNGQKNMLSVQPQLNKVQLGLARFRAEYIHRYNQLLEREKQPHSDFFVNLSEDVEDELDFSEERPADLVSI